MLSLSSTNTHYTVTKDNLAISLMLGLQDFVDDDLIALLLDDLQDGQAHFLFLGRLKHQTWPKTLRMIMIDILVLYKHLLK